MPTDITRKIDGCSISEKEFESQVKDLAKIFGWKYYHTWRSIHSPAGFPDCCIVKPPRLIFAELKTDKGEVSTHQQEWIDILSQCLQIEVYIWKPSQFNEIVELLRRPLV